MSATFSAVFESAVLPHGTLGGDNPQLLRTRESLDRLATKNGLTSLLAFESYAPEDVAGLIDDERLAELPPAVWFPAAAGVAAVNALYEYLESHPGAFSRPAEVMAELSNLGDELEAAARAGVRFRLAVVM
ncbi:hypothetical protein GobsT_04850 [Gemmata obscuriglobus]|uniref:Uncharacterized protein n=1 Tax=Gemmata obscuriglobus TaxID=114 RepID=A0A2Z3HD92_9BACT|nr:hypothetical protein [Gemmata obscuriglobus]AWM40935.1 hypothetical protein C1280_30760 [Gemmata obscuriglobus]QEG25758.1 hypothetical protein GobsT_04850 [Gemmata obscuriglobus]VTR99551.1 Uncharacterized protein OS=Candidatus Entotheonella sp. TSY1 GN=ETSY1_37545 PE=4 SV=1 [Gemmata obscuriglobus UQM 2246]